MYGHLAVVFFLVVSGFSLAVGPARHGWRLAGSASSRGAGPGGSSRRTGPPWG